MPEIHGGEFQVSKQEERYLRRAFRRFALPYVVVLLAALGAWGAVTGFRLGPAHDPAGSSEVQSLIAEAASLRQAIGALREELDGVARRAEEGVSRVSSLEKRVAKLADATEAIGATALRRRLEQAHQRINALDARVEAVTAAARANAEATRLSERRREQAPPPPASPGATESGWSPDPLR